jgi:hypothetical protein
MWPETFHSHQTGRVFNVTPSFTRNMHLARSARMHEDKRVTMQVIVGQLTRSGARFKQHEIRLTIAAAAPAAVLKVRLDRSAAFDPFHVRIPLLVEQCKRRLLIVN